MDSADIRRITREYWKTLYTHTFDNVVEMDQFLLKKKHNYHSSLKNKINYVNSLIILIKFEYIIWKKIPQNEDGSLENLAHI